MISQSNPRFLDALQTNALVVPHTAFLPLPGLLAKFSCRVFCYPASLSDHISANVLEDWDFNTEYIKTNQQRLAESYHFTISFLKEHGIPYHPASNAGFFIWVNLGEPFERSLSESMKARLTLNDTEKLDRTKLSADIMDSLMEKKVFLASGKAFGSDEEGWFRIVFAHPKEYLSTGLQRIVDVVKQG